MVFKQHTWELSRLFQRTLAVFFYSLLKQKKDIEGLRCVQRRKQSWGRVWVTSLLWTSSEIWGCLARRQLRGTSPPSTDNLNEGVVRSGIVLFSRGKRQEDGNGLKFCQGTLRSGITKNFLTARLVRHWNRLLRELMELPALEVANNVWMWHLQVLINPTVLMAKEVLPPLLVEEPQFIHSFLTCSCPLFGTTDFSS